MSRTNPKKVALFRLWLDFGDRAYSLLRPSWKVPRHIIAAEEEMQRLHCEAAARAQTHAAEEAEARAQHSAATALAGALASCAVGQEVDDKVSPSPLGICQVRSDSSLGAVTRRLAQ